MSQRSNAELELENRHQQKEIKALLARVESLEKDFRLLYEAVIIHHELIGRLQQHENA